MAPLKLLIATRNPGKVVEYRHLLRSVPAQLFSLDDLGISEEVAETGATFAENAWLKASTYSALSGVLTLSDDSGLEVDALAGAPGVYSARYGGSSCSSDEARARLLLANLAGTPWPKRTARFRCVIAIAGPADGTKEPVALSVVGSVAGMIQYGLQGDEGFGYDPVFYLPSLGKTMGQLALTEKNRISHRADALGRAIPLLQRLAAALA